MFIVLLLVAILSGIIGYLIGVKTNRNEQKYIAVQPKFLPTPTLVRLTLPTATPNPATVNWQTYTDAKYGFSFKYPSYWILNKLLMETNNEADNPHVVWFNIVNNNNPRRTPIQVSIWTDEHNNQSLSQWFQVLKERPQGDEFTLPPQQISIGGYEAIRTRATPAFETDLIVAPTLNAPRTQYTMNIFGKGEGYADPYSETDSFAQQEITNFHLVLSSFRFPK